MSNPAFELHEVFMGWREQLGDQGNKKLLHVINVDSAEGSNALIRVFALIARISDAIDAAEVHTTRGLDVYRTDLQKWVRIAIGRSSGWSSNTSAESAVPAASIDDLQRLGHFLDGKVLEIDPPKESTIRQLLTDTEELVRESSLSPELTKYSLALVRDIRAALDGEELGFGFDLGDSIRRLWVCLGAAETEARGPKQKERFSKLRSVILPNVATGVATQTILQAGTFIAGEIASGAAG